MLYSGFVTYSHFKISDDLLIILMRLILQYSLRDFSRSQNMLLNGLAGPLCVPLESGIAQRLDQSSSSTRQTHLLGPLISEFPRLLQTFILTARVVVCLTYAVMPLLSRLFSGWL